MNIKNYYSVLELDDTIIYSVHSLKKQFYIYLVDITQTDL